MAKCPDCNGSSDLLGLYGDGKCSVCHGNGMGDMLDRFSDSITGAKSKCWNCAGTGVCPTCGGTGETEG